MVNFCRIGVNLQSTPSTCPKTSDDFHIFFSLFRGFCYFNSVAIAARLLRLKLSVERVLIVDWVSSSCCGMRNRT